MLFQLIRIADCSLVEFCPRTLSCGYQRSKSLSVSGMRLGRRSRRRTEPQFPRATLPNTGKDHELGIVGANIAGQLLRALGITVGGGVVGAIVAAVIGSVVLLLIIRLIKRT